LDAPPGFRLDLTVWALRPRAHNEVDAWDGKWYRRTVVLGGEPTRAVLTSAVSEMVSEHARLASLAHELASAPDAPGALAVAEELRSQLAAHLEKHNERLLFWLRDEGRADLAELLVDIHYATIRIRALARRHGGAARPELSSDGPSYGLSQAGPV
jgi:hypothetical protein